MEDSEKTIENNKKIVQDIDHFIKNYLINAMKKSNISYSTMLIILETLFEKISELNNTFKEGENIEL